MTRAVDPGLTRLHGLRRSLGFVLVLALGGCHTSRTIDETIPADAIARRTDKPPRALSPTATITSDGHLKFVRGKACEMQVYKRVRTYRKTEIGPNLSTVIVGLVLGSVGAVVSATGFSTGNSIPAFGGAGAVALAAPMVALPFLGNETTTKEIDLDEFRASVREERCGNAPLEAERAVLTFQNVRVAGLIDPEGVFTIPLFQFIDAYAYERVRGSASAVIDDSADPIEWVLDAEKLAPTVDGFLRAQRIDASIQDLEKVPNLSGEKFSVALSRGTPYRVALVSVTIRNDGPGTAWGVRARVDSALPELRSRYMYIGRLGPGQTAEPILAIPLADPTLDLQMANLSLMILDAHKTAPNVPLSQPRISVN